MHVLWVHWQKWGRLDVRDIKQGVSTGYYIHAKVVYLELNNTGPTGFYGFSLLTGIGRCMRQVFQILYLHLKWHQRHIAPLFTMFSTMTNHWFLGSAFRFSALCVTATCYKTTLQSSASSSLWRHTTSLTSLFSVLSCKYGINIIKILA